MKSKLLILTIFSTMLISAMLGSCTKTGLNDIGAVQTSLNDSAIIDTSLIDTTGIDSTGIGTFPKTWLDGTWKKVKEIEMPDHGMDTIIRTTGCEFAVMRTFNKGGYNMKPDSAAGGCPAIGGVKYRYTLSADSNKVRFFRLDDGRAWGGYTFTGHTDSTYFISYRMGNIWSDDFYEKQK
jgi:hypothetical protein